MMKRYAFLLCALLAAAVSLRGQSIVVADFQPDETDLTAMTAGTEVMDQNGQRCALLKVRTTQTGFTFDVGSLGVVRTEQHVGEVWVYVPEGVKRITISHQQLGTLSDHDLGLTLKRGKTYLLRLTTGEVQTTVRQARTSQFVVFRVSPPNAVVELNGEIVPTSDGTATKLMPFGTYRYDVKAPDYLPETGHVTVNDPKNKCEVNVQLRPNFRRVTLTVDKGAEIWVNGERRGSGAWTSNLGAGTYLVETRLQNHRPGSREVVITASDEPQEIRLDAPVPILGEASINSVPAVADIFIDGQPMGQTPLIVPDLLVGPHEVKITKQGYADYQATLTVAEGQTADLAATLTRQSAPLPGTSPSGGAYYSSMSPPPPVLPPPVLPPPPSAGARGSLALLPLTVGGVRLNMVRVDGGTFRMGGTSEQGSDADSDEMPVHDVTLSAFYIGETEVTQALWQAVMGANPSHWKGDRLPVEEVSWNDCQTFVRKLSEATGRKFRLPTEAEWEYAARGGRQSKGWKYSGGNDLGTVAWYGGNSGNETHEVKGRQPNELGLYDMSGNVWEWCQDWYGSYPSSAQTNPSGPSSGSDRVYRGGSWLNNVGVCRVSNRYFNDPTFRDSHLGLRLVLVP